MNTSELSVSKRNMTPKKRFSFKIFFLKETTKKELENCLEPDHVEDFSTIKDAKRFTNLVDDSVFGAYIKDNSLGKLHWVKKWAF